MHRIVDPDGNIIERGMACVFDGRTYVVGYAENYVVGYAENYVVGYAENAVHAPRKLVCLDGRNADGQLHRVFLAGIHLRQVHLLGYRLPLIW